MTEQSNTEEQSEEKETCGDNKFQQVNQFQNESIDENELMKNQDQNLRLEKQDEVKWPTTDPNMPIWKYAFKSVLVVDECSLVSVRTISTVLNILKRHADLNKVILLGDVRQLPSVEPGNFLCDIFRVLYPLGCCMELRTNHRAESEIIVGNATKISQMKLPMFDGEKFQLIEIKANEGDVETDTEIKKLLETAPDLQQETSQFVCFQRKKCESINELCCKFYNKHVTRGERGKYMFQVGDKVCMSKNADVVNFRNRLPNKAKRFENLERNLRGTQLSKQRPRNLQNKLNAVSELAMMDSADESFLQSNEVKMEEKKKKKKIRKNKTVRLCNGEIFFILEDTTVTEHDGKSRRFITLSDKEEPNEKIVCVDYRDLTKKCKMRHGWARTIHTYQGSESTAVVYVVYKSYYENWQHVYTAVTRGRNSVYMVGKKYNVEKAIRTDKKERRTSLKEKLMAIVEKFPEILQQLKEELENLLQKSNVKRQQILDNGGASSDVDLFDSDSEDWDDNDNYIDALCDLLLPTNQASKIGDNSVSIEGNHSEDFCKQFHKAVVDGRPEHNVLKSEDVHQSEKGDNLESDENSLMFDSDDSYMKTLDESGLIFKSQMTQFTQYRDEHDFTKDTSFDDSPHKHPITCARNPDLHNPQTPSNLIKRQLSECGDAVSPQKSQRISILVSPVRRSLEQTLVVTKTKK